MSREFNNDVILDAAAFDVLDRSDGESLRELMRTTWKNEGEVKTAAVTLAEVCRGTARTRRVEAILARQYDGRTIAIVGTDAELAKMVGGILFGAKVDSSMIVDGYAVAVAALTSAFAIVVTADPDDIARLAAQVPGVRIVTRSPRAVAASR